MKWAQLCSNLNIPWHWPSLGFEWKLTFSSSVATAEFSKFLGILRGALLTASCFRTLNGSARIPSPPLALLVVMFPKAHLTSHSRMSSSRWVTALLWLSRSKGHTFFCIALLGILATSSQSLLLLLGPYSFCPLLCPSLHEMFLWQLQFSWRDL